MASIREITINPIDPANDVVSVDEVKTHCNIDYDVDESMVSAWIAAARVALEQFTGRVFLKSDCSAIWESGGYCREYVYRLCFSDNIELADGSQYEVNKGQIVTNDSVIEIDYVAGYEVDEIPKIVKQAVLMYCADLSESRGEERQDKTVGKEAKQHIAPFIKSSFFF